MILTTKHLYANASSLLLWWNNLPKNNLAEQMIYQVLTSMSITEMPRQKSKEEFEEETMKEQSLMGHS